MEEKESDLARKDHWDSVFNTEIKNFEDTLKSHNCNGDVGEVWFGEHVQAKAVDYIHNNFDDKHIAILDIGWGNAAFLIAMYEEHGFDNLTGVDYSEKSVELAQMIVNKMLEERNDGNSDTSNNFIYFKNFKVNILIELFLILF